MITSTMLKSSIIYNFVDINFIASSVYRQCVRWRRKPRWLPVAKSKLFRVPERTQTPEEERVELMRLHNNYRTQTRAIRRFLGEELAKTTSTGQAAILQAQLDEEEHIRCMEENQRWNTQVAQLRERRLAKMAEEQKEEIFNRIVAREQIEKEQLALIEELVRDEKVKSVSYITAENIDQAIAEALANPVDPNYAIDMEGHIYRGRDTKPSSVPPEEREKIESSV